jgi:tRNA (guanine-N7-)-methyltransferase
MKTQDGSLKNRAIRSFVRRQGRITPGQRRALNTHWPHYGIPTDQGLVNLTQLFGREAKRVLEIGFGMGDSLIALAKQYPQVDFIGVEVFSPGIGAVLNRIGQAQLTNLRLFCQDATDVLAHRIQDEALDSIYLFFPDPWPKQRHQKRRLLKPSFAHLLSQKLCSGGTFYMATDWQDYANEALQTLMGTQTLQNLAGADFAPRPDFRPLTKFERRGLGLGHKVWDLAFTKKAAQLPVAQLQSTIA